MESSESWSLPEPLSAVRARNMLEELNARLTSSEQAYRKTAFAKAREFVDRAEANGGVDAPIRKSYPIPARADHRRVDIEVSKGKAFVPTEGK